MENAINFGVTGQLNSSKLHHEQLKLEGVCVRCAHCAMKLTDSVSIERGIGPTCSKHGYHEDPVNGDEIQAMIILSDYPELIKFLTDHYKPLGLRGLMNGLVKVCSLNRKAPVHKICCEAIELLGFRNLASTLRKSLVSVSIWKPDTHPGCLAVNVVRRDWRPEWSHYLKDMAYGAFFDKALKALIIPVHLSGDTTKVAVNSDSVSNRVTLWESLVRYYPGLILETPDGNIEIRSSARKAI
jgi:hypothetical protein